MERLQSEPPRADTYNIQLYITRVEVTVFHRNFSNEAFILFTDLLGCSDWINRAPLAAHHSSFPIYPRRFWQPWCITWLLWPVQKTVSPTKLSRDAHYSLRYRHMHAGSSSHPTPKVPALKQFIEASLHGHGFWNSNCYLIWLQVLAPLHLRATLKRPFLRSTCITHNRGEAHLMPLFLPHLRGIMSFKGQNNEKMNLFKHTYELVYVFGSIGQRE